MISVNGIDTETRGLYLKTPLNSASPDINEQTGEIGLYEIVLASGFKDHKITLDFALLTDLPLAPALSAIIELFDLNSPLVIGDLQKDPVRYFTGHVSGLNATGLTMGHYDVSIDLTIPELFWYTELESVTVTGTSVINVDGVIPTNCIAEIHGPAINPRLYFGTKRVAADLTMLSGDTLSFDLEKNIVRFNDTTMIVDFPLPEDVLEVGSNELILQGAASADVSWRARYI